MTALHIIFYIFATVAVTSGLMVVIAKNSMHSVLFLVLAFFAMAGIWIMLSAEFLALILVLVYVGAVMTLFLFVVMMLNFNIESKREGFVRYLPFGAVILLTVLSLTIMVIGPGRFGLAHLPAPAPFAPGYSNVADLGLVLYTNYAYPFVVSGVLLLTAIVAAICLTHRPPKKAKTQNVSQQIAVRREDRVRLVDLPAEKKIKLTGLPLPKEGGGTTG